MVTLLAATSVIAAVTRYSLMLTEIDIRTLNAEETRSHRELASTFPDQHLAVVLHALPRYSEMTWLFENDEEYFKRQRLILGAFESNRLIGTVAIQKTTPRDAAEWSEDQWNVFYDRFTQTEFDAFDTWNSSLSKTFLNAPHHSLALHSLAVSPKYRRRSVATRLISAVISNLSSEERNFLFAETARRGYLTNLFVKNGFRAIRRSFSLSERLEYGQWGSVLMRYANGG